MNKIRKVLVANRGEIAIRIMRTCREMDIRTVGIYSRPDAFAPHVLAADESCFIGEAPSSQSYLVAERIIETAKSMGCDAIHPGYGFLSENAGFSQLCDENGILFIGPGAQAIRLMGDKTSARTLMTKAGVPLPPGTTTALQSPEEAIQVAEEIGYPVLIKASAGGGGKGMRIVHHPHEIRGAVASAQSEAKNAFGDERVYVEKYLEEPRHIEFQIMADKHGNVVHIFDRECSIQRRHQKVVEEAPSPLLDDDLRARMAEAAVTAARSCGYVGAGTIEFLVDKNRDFFFLEMNTRLQVEHPITELISGLDLVEWQIRVAQGEVLGFTQEDLRIQGHAIECRICAEDPSEQFLPSTGTVTRHVIPSGPGVRVDAGVREGQHITINYDPLMSKLVVHAADRAKAIARMDRALQEYQISGVETTIPFCQFVMRHPLFAQGRYDTHFIKDHFSPEMLSTRADIQSSIPYIAGALLQRTQDGAIAAPATSIASISSSTYETSNWWSKRRH